MFLALSIESKLFALVSFSFCPFPWHFNVTLYIAGCQNCTLTNSIFYFQVKIAEGPCTSDICVYDYLVLIIIYVMMDVFDVVFSWLNICVLLVPPWKKTAPAVSSPCPEHFSPLLRIRQMSNCSTKWFENFEINWIYNSSNATSGKLAHTPKFLPGVIKNY